MTDVVSVSWLDTESPPLCSLEEGMTLLPGCEEG